jgi:hypothetical protein
LRGWAYVAGAVSFAVPWSALAAVPKPPTTPRPAPPQVVDVKKLTRRIIIHDPPRAHVVTGGASVRYVYVGGGGGGGAASGGVHTHCSTC